MRYFFLLIKTFAILFLCSSIGFTKESNNLIKGIELFDKKKFEKSKIFFERDLVFNPKSEKSYLYLAKIFNENDNDEEQEIHLNNVLTLNPQNEEAIYMLTLLRIKQFDYKGARELIDKFVLDCKSFCSKKNEMQEKLEKLTPENAKTDN